MNRPYDQRRDRRRGIIAFLLAGTSSLMLGLSPRTCLAEVKEYQIRRMLLLKTECQVTGLETSVKDGRDRFYASCDNASHYPEGVEILCPDTEDERDCSIVTVKQEFRNLELLRR